jgi:hypothetical protein
MTANIPFESRLGMYTDNPYREPMSFARWPVIRESIVPLHTTFLSTAPFATPCAHSKSLRSVLLSGPEAPLGDRESVSSARVVLSDAETDT